MGELVAHLHQLVGDGAVREEELVGDLLVRVAVDVLEVEDVPLPVRQVQGVPHAQDLLVARQPSQFRRCHPIPYGEECTPIQPAG